MGVQAPGETEGAEGDSGTMQVLCIRPRLDFGVWMIQSALGFFKIPFFFSSFHHAHTGQDASLLHCLCVWIITSLDASATSEVMGHMDGVAESHEWGLPDLALLWQWLLKKQKARILLHGFQLFLEVSWPGSLAQPSEAHGRGHSLGGRGGRFHGVLGREG